MKFLVLGAGAQGSACAFELLQRPEVDRVVLADLDVNEPRPFLKHFLGGALELLTLDATDEVAVRSALESVDGVASALPYYFNLDMTRLAIESKANFCDLGGNTEIVDQQRKMTVEAQERDVSVVPDCGLAPGMVNILAQGGIDALDETESVKIYVGGLPQVPEPPLNYQLVYSLEGVLDYYTTPVLVLEGGEVIDKEPLTGVETVTFEALGELEAFLTAGGISRMPYRYRGLIPSMSYKTLRYPGHCELMKSMRNLGLMDLDPVEIGGASVVPRDLLIKVLDTKLRKPSGKDLVVMRVVIDGAIDGASRTVTYEMVDYYDQDQEITAMMRTTGYSLGATAYMQAAGLIPKGVHTPSECVPAEMYIQQLANRGIVIERSEN
ncbi:MAG: saccharopine dehydrogenase C-terminal domain-containing protein [Gemmatimonadota bacterium]|nr:saccharopine dehydrogenase C-terminal domain-containing protein [Gemmatimonadota bacterium]MEC9317001.1 saccharopine dehydrogenase C-terminal domain-containing protein [Gemmatimonadota bacterium]